MCKRVRKREGVGGNKSFGLSTHKRISLVFVKKFFYKKNLKFRENKISVEGTQNNSKIIKQKVLTFVSRNQFSIVRLSRNELYVLTLKMH